jgi:hypothetical protein
MACVWRSLACFADPPAESPSTRKISVPLFPSIEQSASLPGKGVFFLFIFFSMI